jgi:hypothetical protein
VEDLPRATSYYLWGSLILIGHTDKKENQVFLTYKEIQKGAVAKLYMTNGLLIYGEVFAYFLY